MAHEKDRRKKPSFPNYPLDQRSQRSGGRTCGSEMKASVSPKKGTQKTLKKPKGAKNSKRNGTNESLARIAY